VLKSIKKFGPPPYTSKFESLYFTGVARKFDWEGAQNWKILWVLC